MERKIVTRWRASGLHLLISAAVAGTVLAVMLAVWFPGPLFVASGGSILILILVGVDVIVGPLITLMVYRQGKRGMKFDLVAIAALQLAAFAYGVHVVYLARPAFIVFVKDQFQVAAVVAIEPEEFAKARFPQFRSPPLGGPLYAYADIPTDPNTRNVLIFAGLAGRDLETIPRYFSPYAERTQDVLKAASTLARLRAQSPREAKIMDATLASAGLKEADVRYVRLKARRAWVGVLLDAKTAAPLAMTIVDKI
jgi:hypothetical protein